MGTSEHKTSRQLISWIKNFGSKGAIFMNHDIEKEGWTRWDPAIKGLEEIVYHITTFLDNEEGVTLTIVCWNRPPEAPTFRLFFKAPVIFYSKSGDSLCLISDNPPLIDYGPVAVDKWAFYKLTNSQQIARFKKSFLLFGDDLYGRTNKLITRQALHAWKLAFEYKGQSYTYVCRPPQDFIQLVHALHSETKKGDSC